jgi:hypothetical protein
MGSFFKVSFFDHGLFEMQVVIYEQFAAVFDNFQNGFVFPKCPKTALPASLRPSPVWRQKMGAEK